MMITVFGASLQVPGRRTSEGTPQGSGPGQARVYVCHLRNAVSHIQRVSSKDTNLVLRENVDRIGYPTQHQLEAKYKPYS